nr:SLC13 family permease [Candidatus Sigynarchaeota archaeon]
MVGEIIAAILVLVLFILIPVVAAKPKLDLTAYAIMAMIIGGIVTVLAFPSPAPDFIKFIRFEPLIYIISINIIVIIMEKNSVFQFLAVEIIHFTKSNPRVFFAMICIMATFTSAVLEDVSVALIYMPIVVQACKVLKIRVEPFIFGIAVCLNIGNLFMPFSNSQNIIIAADFHLGVAWFAAFMFPILVLSMLLVIWYFDFFEIKKQEPPAEEFKDVLLKVLDAKLVVKDPRKFKTAAITFIIIVACLVIIPYTFIVASIGAIVMCWLERESLPDVFKKVDWSTVFFFIALFIITGCMVNNGTMGLISAFVIQIATGNVLVASIVILVVSSLITSALSPNPATVFFLPVFSTMFALVPSLGGTWATQAPILVAFILGLNIGGNFLVQGAPPYVVTVAIGKKSDIPGVNYKSMTRVGIKFSVLHILLCIGYLAIVCAILGVL